MRNYFYIICLSLLVFFQNEKLKAENNNPNPVSAVTGSSFFNKNEIRIYPNPATNYLHLNCNSQVKDEVSIVDVSGKIIMNKKQFESKQIDITSVNPGAYFLNK